MLMQSWLREVQEELRHVNFMDDDYARLSFEDNIRDTKMILRIIMDKPIIVKSVKVQETFYEPDNSHSVRFDVYAVDLLWTQYDIEIQNASEEASQYRAAYNSAMMTVNSLKKDSEQPQEEGTLFCVGET